MACDMTYYQLGNNNNEYRPFIPVVQKNSTQSINQPTNKLVIICRCACRHMQVVSGGLHAT